MCQSRAEGGRRCALHHPGTRAVLTHLRVVTPLDRPQCEALFSKAVRRAKPDVPAPSVEEWAAFVDGRIERVALDPTVDEVTFERVARALHASKKEPPEGRTFAALTDLDNRAAKATAAIERQIAAAAAFRGVDVAAARERFLAYRGQYLHDFARTPLAARPMPPETWVRGFTTKDMKAVSVPADKATLYAFYRCQADPDAFATPTGQRFASIDLETAGPDGKDGFNPENGSIIEVGIVEYDMTGTETDRYATLIAPTAEVAARCGTGAVQVHGITLDDLAGAPDWETVAPQVADRLHGRTLLAQNAHFEKTWLNHHLHRAGEEFDRTGPTVDTLCIARQHVPDLPSHQLSQICGEVGVAYTGGHRATHDAVVAAEAFFALRQRIFAAYRANSVMSGTVQPPRADRSVLVAA